MWKGIWYPSAIQLKTAESWQHGHAVAKWSLAQETAGRRVCAFWSHAPGCYPGWGQRVELRAAAVPSCPHEWRQECAVQKLYSGASETVPG